MRERIVIEFHSDRDRDNLLNELSAMGYVVGPQWVKVCSMGMCGQAHIFSK